MELARVFIGLGSNIEPRLEFLKSAVNALRTIGEIAHVSSVYETSPVGGVPQHEYLNAVVELQTSLGPIELARQLKAFENTLGRKERPRWHEREIDLDLLFYEDLILESPDLILPHSELHRRAFVLVPLAELDPDFLHPVQRKTILQLLESVGNAGVKKTEWTL